MDLLEVLGTLFRSTLLGTQPPPDLDGLEGKRQEGSSPVGAPGSLLAKGTLRLLCSVETESIWRSDPFLHLLPLKQPSGETSSMRTLRLKMQAPTS